MASELDVGIPLKLLLALHFATHVENSQVIDLVLEVFK